MRIFGPLMRVRTPARALSDGRGSGAPYGRTTGASTRELLIQAARTLIGRGADSPKDREVPLPDLGSWDLDDQIGRRPGVSDLYV